MRHLFWAFIAFVNLCLTGITIGAMLYTFGWIATLTVYSIGALTIGLQVRQAFLESQRPAWTELPDNQYDELAAKVNAARQKC